MTHARSHPSNPSLGEPRIPGALPLRVFFFMYLLCAGIMVPFFPMVLRGRGLTGTEIALVLACTPLMHLTTPFVWGWLADRTRRPDLVAQIAVLGTALAFVPLSFSTSFAGLWVSNLVTQFFFTPLPGLSDSLAMMRVRMANDVYGRIRLWGSVSFMLAAATMGLLLTHRWGDKTNGPLVPLVAGAFLLLAFFVAFFVRGGQRGTRPRFSDTRRLLADRRLIFLIVVGGIHWGCTAPFHNFFGAMVQDRGFPRSVLGWSFALSVLAELLVFFFGRSILQRARLSTLFSITMFGSALRWSLSAWVVHPAALIAVQVLHGLTYGVFWSVSVSWLHGLVPENLRVTGQTLFTAGVLGVGNLAGVLITGQLYDWFGSLAPALWAAGGTNLLLAFVCLTVGRRMTPQTEM
ncbi:MAG: MFS transporter [Deltaproteobacteria bacterium]|nr:MFS transporter [Deltaproteobacteria bacterium]